MIFVSHAYQDQAQIVSALIDGLKAGGIHDIWYSKNELPTGSNYLFDQFNKGIASCEKGLIVLTPAYLEAAYAHAEFRALHNRHIYQEKELYILLIGVSADTIGEKYPLISDLYMYTPKPGESMVEMGVRMAGILLGGDREPLMPGFPKEGPDTVPVLPVMQRNPAVSALSPEIKRKRLLWAMRGLGSALAVAGVWLIYTSGLFWHYSPIRPKPVRPALLLDTLVQPVSAASSSVKPAPGASSTGCLPAGASLFLRKPGFYRVYLGAGRFCSVKSLKKQGNCGFSFTYVPPIGWNVDAKLTCAQGTCAGTYDGVTSDGRIIELTFRADGTAQGYWHTVVKAGGTVLQDTFAIVKMPL